MKIKIINYEKCILLSVSADVYKRQHLFRSVYTGTRADHKRALGNEDMKRVFCKLSQSSGASSNMRRAQEFCLFHAIS